MPRRRKVADIKKERVKVGALQQQQQQQRLTLEPEVASRVGRLKTETPELGRVLWVAAKEAQGSSRWGEGAAPVGAAASSTRAASAAARGSTAGACSRSGVG